MGISERKAREKEARRNAIIDAAEEVFFNKGTVSATMDDIADTAELSKGTLYLYFRSKEDIYMAITQRGLEILNRMFAEALDREETGLEKVRGIGRAYFDFSREHPNYFDAMLYFDLRTVEHDERTPCNEACAAEGEKTILYVQRALEAGIRDGTIRADLDPKKSALILWGLSNGVIQLLVTKLDHLKREHAQLEVASAEEIIEYAFQMVGMALVPRAPGGKS